MTAEPPSGGAAGGRGRRESPAERADRNFVEMLQGFRVAVTGIQVLFAFLLTVPFSPGFARISEGSRWIYFVSLLGAATASMFYIAPAVQHRILFRKGMKEALVKRANVYGVIGTVALAISMTAATLLVVDYLFSGALSVVTAVLIALLATWLWFVSPTLARGDHRLRRSADAAEKEPASESESEPEPSAEPGPKAEPEARSQSEPVPVPRSESVPETGLEPGPDKGSGGPAAQPR